jgi:hypothetical protein
MVIIFRHILPNTISPILVQATVDMGTVILAMGGLAFLGLGTQPPAPDWGLMVSEGRTYMLNQWWIATYPGLAIFIVVLAFNLIGDTLRDIDPRRTDEHLASLKLELNSKLRAFSGLNGVSFQSSREIFSWSGGGTMVTGLSILRCFPIGLHHEFPSPNERTCQRCRQKMVRCDGTMIFQDPSSSLNPVFTVGSQMACASPAYA